MIQPQINQEKEKPTKEIISTVSSKGQVTIPVEVRRKLGVDTNDKVAFVIEATGEVKLTQASYPDIRSLKGVVGSLKEPLSFKEMKQIAYEDRKKFGYETKR